MDGTQDCFLGLSFLCLVCERSWCESLVGVADHVFHLVHTSLCICLNQRREGSGEL